MEGQQHPDGAREIGHIAGGRPPLDPNAARNTHRYLPPQQVGSVNTRGMTASDPYGRSNLRNAVPSSTVNAGPIVGHRGQNLLPQAGAAASGRRDPSVDLDIHASSYIAAPGNPARAGSRTGSRGPYQTPPGPRVGDNRLQGVGNRYDGMGSHAQDRPTSRPAPTSASDPIVGFGVGSSSPRQQHPQPQYTTSAAHRRHMRANRAGITTSYPNPNASSTNVPRQSPVELGLPPVPSGRQHGGLRTIRQALPRTTTFPTNQVQVSSHPRVPNGVEAYEGTLAQRTTQGEQPHRHENTPNATSAYGHSTLNPSGAYGLSAAYGEPSIHGQSSTCGEPSVHGQPSVYGQPSIHGQPPLYGQPSAYGSLSSAVYGFPTMNDPSSAHGSSGVNQSAVPYGSTLVPAPSEHDFLNNGATPFQQSFPAYDSHADRIARGLPPHLVGPEPLVPHGPVNWPNPEYNSFPTNAGAENGSNRGQDRYQPAATTTGTIDTRVTQGTSRDAPTSSTRKPREPSGRTNATIRAKRTPGRINHGEVRESADGSLRFRAEGADKWELTTQHEENRRAMINWASRFGQYTHLPARGPHPDDETSYHPSQQHWRFQGHHDWHPSQDATLYRFQREGFGVLTYTPGPLRWRGRVVLNRENVPITDWQNIPLTCASVMEGGRMEQIQRDDARITNEDFQDRQPARSGRRPLPGLSAMGNRKRRFRENNGLASWEVREGTKRITDLIRSHLSEEQLANNTTRGFDRLPQQELQNIRDNNARSGYFKSRAGKKALTDDEKRRRAQEKQAKGKKRKRDESDEEDVGDDGDGPDNDEQP